MKSRGRLGRRIPLSVLAGLLGATMLSGLVPSAAQGVEAQRTGPAVGDITIEPAGPLLVEPRSGRKAIRQLGENVDAAAARNDLSPSDFRSLLRSDETAWVDPQGALLFIEPVPSEPPPAATAPPASRDVAPGDAFALHSNPSSTLTIFLDFDGATVSDTAWNSEYGVTPGAHPAWDPGRNGPAFNDAERRLVHQIWASVAEDYAPFDVDVTTADPGAEALERSSSSDLVYGTRVIVTPSDDPFVKICNRACGGVAYIDVFDAVGSYHQPAWVFAQPFADNPKYLAEVASHEAGHNLALLHDGTGSSGYYEGQGIWAPIMGSGYTRPLVQWSAGSYPGGNNGQDDLSILEDLLGSRDDEASDSVATASMLPDGAAVIGTSDDVDAYHLGTCSAGSTVRVSPAALAPNLDVQAQLFDATGTRRGLAQPASGPGTLVTASGLGADLTVPSTGDGWVLTVEGAGQGTWSSDGYDDYASLGSYTIDAPGCDGDLADGVPSSPSGVATAGNATDSLTLTWAAPATAGAGPVTGYLVSRSGSSAVETLPADARSHTFGGLARGAAYQMTVRAVNATGAGPSVTVNARTADPAPAAPGSPRDVTGFYDQQTGKLFAYWTEPADTGSEPIGGYVIYLDGSYLGVLAPTERGVEITRDGGFTEGTYVVGIAASNAVGSSPPSNVAIEVRFPDRPANDNVVNASVLLGTRGTVSGDNGLATREGTDPTPPSARGAGGYSVWYSFQPAADGQVTLMTSGGGSDRDTTLAAYTGSPGSLVQVAGNDDWGWSDWGQPLRHSRIAFVAEANVRYLVAVDGFGFAGGTGPFTLDWNQVVPTAPSAPQQVRATPGDTTATISWSAATANGSPITSYTITSSPGGAVKTVDPDTLSTTISDLTNGTAYTFTVTATNTIGTSPASEKSNAVTPAGVPGRVSKPQSTVKNKKVSLRWSPVAANGGKITGYTVAGSKGLRKTVGPGRTKVVFGKLKPGRYKFWVIATNDVGKSRSSKKIHVRIR